MGIATLSLAGLFIAIYMYLYKIGKIGSLVCGTGACVTVQLSPQARFLGVEVALIGVFGYAVMLLLALLALQPRFAGPAWPSRLLPVLAGGGVFFTAYLTYGFVRPRISRALRREIEEEDDEEPAKPA